MFEQILVPLDGSKLSARVLVQVRRLLKAGEQVSLLLVVSPEELSEHERESGVKDKADLGARLRAARVDLQGYLDELRGHGVEATGQVLIGRPAAVILTQANLTEPSLVAMATHGRGGLGRWVRGSVAERVLKRCPAPLLLVNPKTEGEVTHPFKRILVPLDGSERSASILPLVSRFARVQEAEVVLLRVSEVVPATSDVDYPPWALPGPLALDEGDLRDSIERYRVRLSDEGVSARSLGVVEDNVAEGILETVARERADLVALTTHGGSGIDRWIFGSVAEKVVRHCTAPLLVHRLGGFTPWNGSR